MTTVFAAASKSTPLIDWASLGKVAVTSAAFGIGVVAVFSLGIYALALVRSGPDAVAAGGPASGSAGNRFGAAAPTQSGGPGAMLLAGACFAACAAAVLFGLWLIIPAFH